jgi:DNA (cytosine-5)-methyltransferase 1
LVSVVAWVVGAGFDLRNPMSSLRFADFFAGSGLVSLGVRHAMTTVWANDICPRKASVYRANHGAEHFRLGSIAEVRGVDLPAVEVVWASFPCQDLSLAGRIGGIGASRSGLFWEWLRVLDEMPERPRVLAIENVVGLVSASGGREYRQLHDALVSRGYRVGPMLLDAKSWLPQSRPRIFVVAVDRAIETTALEDHGANWLHPDAVQKAVRGLEDVVYWSLPRPPQNKVRLSDLIEWDAEVFDVPRRDALLDLLSPAHAAALEKLPLASRAVFPGYRRTRNGRQVLELRFDDLAGCLRTAEGGSSRQFVLLWLDGALQARLLTKREIGALMGAPPDYWMPESYNEAYNAMGDAVAVPVVQFLTDHLLLPLASTNHVRSAAQTAREFCLIA